MPEISRLDQVILDVAAQHGWATAPVLAVGDDPTGALTMAAMAALNGSAGRVLILSRNLSHARRAATLAEERGVRAQVRIAGYDGALDLSEFLREGDGAKQMVLVSRLPKAHAGLDSVARALAASGTSATLVAGENTKHMTRNQNEVLRRLFEDVRASRGQGKFRCLIASSPRSEVPLVVPVTGTSRWGALTGVGGVFAGAQPDRGGEFLAATALEDLRATGVTPAHILDLGSGNGLLSLAMAKEFPDARITATDIDADAVLSTRATLEHIGERARVVWDDAAASVPDESADVLLLNPPFHEGPRIDATLIQHLLKDARRAVAPGGALYLVHNSHLRYRAEVQRRFASVTQIARNATFTVLRGSQPR